MEEKETKNPLIRNAEFLSHKNKGPFEPTLGHVDHSYIRKNIYRKGSPSKSTKESQNIGVSIKFEQVFFKKDTAIIATPQIA